MITIDDIRREIDCLDSELLRIFNQRAELALKIGEIKKGIGAPLYDPAREKSIFLRMKDKNPGPLDDQAVIRLFEKVIEESRRLENTLAFSEK